MVLTYPSKQALAAVMRKIKRTTGRQARRRYYGADRISENGLTLYNPAKITVERYRYRGARIGTPYNLDVVDPAGARIRHTNHDDVAFVGQVSELHHLTTGHVESRMLWNGHVRFGGRRGNQQPKRCTAPRRRPDTSTPR